MIAHNQIIIRNNNSLILREDCFNILQQLDQKIKNCFAQIKDYNYYIQRFIPIEEEFTKITTVLHVIEHTINIRQDSPENINISNYAKKLRSDIENIKTQVLNPNFVNPAKDSFLEKLLLLFIAGIIACLFYSHIS